MRPAKHAGMVIAVGVDERQPVPGQIIRVLKLAARGVVIVVALGVHHTESRREAASSRLVESIQAVAGIAQLVVQLIAQVVVHEPHPGIPVSAISRRLPEMLAEDHRVVAPLLRVEDGIPVIVPI